MDGENWGVDGEKTCLDGEVWLADGEKPCLDGEFSAKVVRLLNGTFCKKAWRLYDGIKSVITGNIP